MKLRDISDLLFHENFKRVIVADGPEQTTFDSGQSYALSLYYDKNREREVKGVITNYSESFIAVELL